MQLDSEIFEYIFKEACECIIVIDEEGKVVLWNKACEEILGYTFDEVFGIEVHRLLCSNDSYDRAKKAFEKVKLTKKSKLSNKVLNLTGYTKSAKTIRVILSLSQIDLKGKLYFIGILRDADRLTMTLPTDSCICLDDLLDVIPVPIFIKDHNLRYIHVNRAFEEFTGIKKIDAKGKTVFELYPQDLAKVYHEQDLKILDKPEKQVYSFKCITKDGSYREVEFHKVSFTNKEGKIAGILGAFIDIQERNELMRKLIHEKQKAEDALQSKSRFISFMSHELRTPLSNIIGYSNLLLTSGGVTNLQEEFLKNIRNMAESLMSILTDLLELSKLEHYTLRLNPEETNLPELIFDVVDNVKFECYLKGLEFYVFISPVLPERVITDKLRLKQILLNLLSNAIKYTDKGYIELSITCDKTSMPENMTKVRFTVSDTGIGISQEQAEKIFEPFYRVETKQSEFKFGIGIGLSLTQKLLELMGSKINLESTVGKGSKFYFDLIFEIVEDNSEKFFEIYQGKKAIMLLDFDKRFASLLSYLFYWGVEVLIPSNEDEIKQILKQQDKIDCVILDSDASFIKNYWVRDLIFENKQQGKIDKVVIIYVPTADIEKIFNNFSAIADFYIQKPVNPTRLFNAFVSEKDTEIIPFQREQFFIFDQPLKILIVDDIEANRKLIRYLINKVMPNAEIFETDNGESAIVIYRVNKPDIIFLDIQMPKIDGYEVLRIIRQTDKDTPIIAISAHTESQEKEKALSEGFNYYITRPITISKLNKILEELQIKQKSSDSKTSSRIDYTYFEENQIEKEFLVNLLRLSLDKIPMYIDEVINFYVQQDINMLKKSAHKLKGASYSAGLRSLASIAESINSIEKFDLEVLRSKIELLRKEWKETEKEIKNFLEQNPID